MSENPYIWVGDNLVHKVDGVVVATFEDFPELVRQRALYEKIRQRIYGKNKRRAARPRS